MTRIIRFSVTAMVTCLAILVTGQELRAQQSLNEFRDLIGRDNYYASVELEKRGYVHIEEHAGDNLSKYEYWWSPSDKQCINAQLRFNEIASVTKASRSDCNQKDNTARDIGIAAGAAALLGGIIALTNKSHHHEDNQHHDDDKLEAAFERGYRDGIHHARYDNIYRESNEAEQYSKGYNAGQKQRTYNIQHHSGNAGGRNRGHVTVTDLRGARASGAAQEMERRGFRLVGNYSNNNARINYYYHPDTRDCIRVTVSNGRFTRVEDGLDYCASRN